MLNKNNIQILLSKMTDNLNYNIKSYSTIALPKYIFSYIIYSENKPECIWSSSENHATIYITLSVSERSIYYENRF